MYLRRPRYVQGIPLQSMESWLGARWAGVGLTPVRGHRVIRLCGLCGVVQLEGYWADLSDGGVASASVVAVFDPGADRELGSGLGSPDAAVVEPGLQCREERLGHRVVPCRQLLLIPMMVSEPFE